MGNYPLEDTVFLEDLEVRFDAVFLELFFFVLF